MTKRMLIAVVLGLILAGCATSKEEDWTPPPKMGDVDLAPEARLAGLRQRVADAPNDADAHYELGNALFDVGLFDEAAAEYQKTLALHPSHARAYTNLGLSLKRLGQVDEAIAAYDKALELAPNDIDTLNNLVIALQGQGSQEACLRPLRQLAALEPENIQVRSDLAALLFNMGRHDEAAQEYLRITKLDPGVSEDWYKLGYCYYCGERYEEARNAWGAAKELDPENLKVYKGLAVVNWRLEDYDAAWTAVQEGKARGMVFDLQFMTALREDSGLLGPGMSTLTLEPDKKKHKNKSR